MKLHTILLLLLTPLAARADHEEELANALKRLHAHQSYRWEAVIQPSLLSQGMTIPTGLPDSTQSPAERSFISRPTIVSRPVPVIGITDKERGTLITATATFVDRESTVDVVRSNGAVIADGLTGWLTPAEIETRLADLPKRGQMPHRGVPEHILLRVAREAVALPEPAVELSALLADANRPQFVNDSLVANLSEPTATRFLLPVGHATSIVLLPTSAKGSVTVWLKQGEIAKYELRIEGSTTDITGDKRTVQTTKTVTLDRFDKASAKLPKGALAKLETLRAPQ